MKEKEKTNATKKRRNRPDGYKLYQKMKFPITCVLVNLCILLHAQEDTTAQQRNTEGMNDLQCFDSCLTEWHENGNIKAKRCYSNGLARGPFISYYENGRVESMGTNIYGLQIGYNNQGQVARWAIVLPSKNIHPENIIEKGESQKNGERIGIWTGAHENGMQAYTCEFKNGILHGEFKYYDTTGELLLQCYYHEGYLHGKLRHWDIPPNGICKFYNFNMGNLKGLSFIYDAEGNLLEKKLHLTQKEIILEKYSPNTFIPIEKTTFDSLGSIMKRTAWNRGKIESIQTYTLRYHPLQMTLYSPSGNPIIEYCYNENRKVQSITEWDENGNVIQSRIITEEQLKNTPLWHSQCFHDYYYKHFKEEEVKTNTTQKKKKLRWL
jgi:antitoxin component YwqK of YwqJK toxin-antitoxin module